jgi:hypothetical protein
MANTNTHTSKQGLDQALSAIPDPFREKLIAKYLDLRRALVEGRTDTTGMRVAYFAETLLRYLQHRLTGTSIPFGKKLPDFTAECLKLEKTPSAPGDEGIRVIMPRALTFVYTLRNKRGLGHVGGDVDPNTIDSATAVRVADWCMCELIRVCRSVSLEEAQAILDALAARQLPQVWAVGGRKRILHNGLDYRSMVLILLHSEIEAGVAVEDLQAWVEHPHGSYFKRDVIRPLHGDRLIEFDEESQVAVISPLGIRRVEEVLLPKMQSQTR